MTLQDLLNKAKPYAIKTFEIIDRPISMRTVQREAEELRSYFQTRNGAETILDFYLKAETARIVEPAGTLHNGKFTFLKTPKERERLYNGLLVGDSKAIEELCAMIENSIANSRSPGSKASNARVLEQIKAYGKDDSNHSRAVIYAEYFLRSSVPIPNDKPGIAVHIHPQKTDYFYEDGQVFLTAQGYSEADRDFAVFRSLGLIEYQSKTAADALTVEFKLSHLYGFAELLADTFTLTAFLEPKTPIFLDIGSKVITLEKRTMRKPLAISYLKQSANLWPLIEIEPENQEPVIRIETNGAILPERELQNIISLLLEVARMEEECARKLYDITWKSD